MSDKEDVGSEAAKAGISAKVLDELEERLVEKIMRRMAPSEGEGSSGRSTGGGGEWATWARSEHEPNKVIRRW